MKIIRIIFSPEAEEVYNYLNKKAPNSKTERVILNSLNKKLELVRRNLSYGDPIPKKQIPKEYKKNMTLLISFG